MQNKGSRDSSNDPLISNLEENPVVGGFAKEKYGPCTFFSYKATPNQLRIWEILLLNK